QLNGRRVGDQLFTPGWTSYHRRLQYQTYDVTALLRPGENAIGAMLGDGWYRGYLGFNGQRNLYGRRLALRLQLEIRYQDGRTERVTSDAGWRITPGPVVGSDIYGGETYDARRERAGWSSAAYRDSAWAPVALLDAPPATLIAPVSPPGQLVTSDSLLNQLQHNIVWGQRSNFLDVPTDCPQRDERLGWTGDAQVFARTAAFNMDVSGFFAKWLGDVASDQRSGGSVPWVIPNPLGGDSTDFAGTAGWSDAAVIIPWTMYLSYGDRGMLERQYTSMRAWVEYARRRAGSELIWRPGWQFGDWIALHSDDPSYPGATTGTDLIATAFLAHSTDLVSRTAAVLGRDQDAAEYRARFRAIREAFNREFVSMSGRVGENTQTAYSLAIAFDLL